MALFGAITLGAALLSTVAAFAYLFWRYVWFFRNPKRLIPKGEDILSPADGKVVYAYKVPAGEPVMSIKGERRISIADIAREDLEEEKILVGIFMSPFDVHYNRAPLSGRVEYIRHHPPDPKNYHMGSMHWNSLLGRLPIHENSRHILRNERTVSKIRGRFMGHTVYCYVVQIAGGSVCGIDTFIKEKDFVERGRIFGMIRVGSQVDVVVSWHESMRIRVKPGERVRAGESVLIEGQDVIP